MSERELLLKLFTTGHLNVPERKELPYGKIRASFAKQIISEMLLGGWFPGKQQFGVGNAGGEYIQLEAAADGKILLHRNTEASINNYAHQIEEFASADLAIESFLKEREERDLDGLKIDWKL